MKKEISKHFRKQVLAATIGTCLLSLFFISCAKDESNAKKSNTNMAQIAAALNSRVQTGSLLTGSSEDGLYLHLDNGTQTVLLEKMPDTEISAIGPIQSASIINSENGIIIKDLTNDKIWLFANNDEPSIQKFQAIQKNNPGNYEFSKVFGTTIINAGNS